MSAVERIGRLLRPASIAVVGASQARNKLAGQIIPSLQATGYAGAIYPINPRYDEVAGVPCYPSVAAVPGAIDHCVVIVAKERVPAVLQECRARAVASASIFSSGYAEAGESGREDQDALRAHAGDMVFLGPNCMGFANLVDRVVGTTSPAVRRQQSAGDVALISQSGGLGYGTISYFARAAGIDFSYIVNTGNSAGISFADLIEFLFADASTRVVVAVIEGEAVVGEVVSAVRRLGLRKPIILLKLGRGATGVRMALSHTGSLAGDYRLMRDCAEQAGIVCADDVDEVLGLIELLRCGFQPAQAQGLAAISISGGNVTLFADQADANELSFATLSEATEQRLRGVLPDYISVHNPIDITALGYEEPDLHRRVLEILLDDDAVNTVVPIITTAEDYTPVCRLLAELKTRARCSMAVLWTGGSYETTSRGLLAAAALPVLHSANAMARCLARLGRAQPAAEPAPSALLVPLLPAGAGPLSESQSLDVLAEAGLPVPRFETCTRADLAETAARVGFPVVLKGDVGETHLSDRGGVILDVRTPADLAALGERLAALPGERILVSRFLPGLELLASTFHHPHFGLTLIVGSGGVLADLLADVRFVHLPAAPERLGAALAGTAVGRALRSGYRGATGFAEAVAFLDGLAGLALAGGERLRQIELNPVTVGRHGVAAVDASIVLG